MAMIPYRTPSFKLLFQERHVRGACLTKPMTISKTWSNLYFFYIFLFTQRKNARSLFIREMTLLSSRIHHWLVHPAPSRLAAHISIATDQAAFTAASELPLHTNGRMISSHSAEGQPFGLSFGQGSRMRFELAWTTCHCLSSPPFSSGMSSTDR